jgi:hypothetical protein
VLYAGQKAMSRGQAAKLALLDSGCAAAAAAAAACHRAWLVAQLERMDL